MRPASEAVKERFIFDDVEGRRLFVMKRTQPGKFAPTADHFDPSAHQSGKRNPVTQLVEKAGRKGHSYRALSAQLRGSSLCGIRATTPRSAQKPPYDRTGLTEIDHARVALAKDRHYLADVLYARRSYLGDGSLCRCLNLTRVDLPRQKAFNDRNFLALLLGEIGAVTLFIKSD